MQQNPKFDAKKCVENCIPYVVKMKYKKVCVSEFISGCMFLLWISCCLCLIQCDLSSYFFFAWLLKSHRIVSTKRWCCQCAAATNCCSKLCFDAANSMTYQCVYAPHTIPYNGRWRWWMWCEIERFFYHFDQRWWNAISIYNETSWWLKNKNQPRLA